MQTTPARRTGCSMPFASICPEPGRGAAATAVLACALVACVPGMSGLATGQSVFRSQAELVVLQVTVVDPRGRFVSDLQLDDFGVYEDGRRQDVSFFAATAAPLDLMLLLDTSASIGAHMGLVQAAAINVLKALKPADRGSVILFNDRVRVAHALTADTRALEAAVNSASPGGATALYEALYIALRDLARPRSYQGELRRQAIVVLSDGDDNSSRVGFDDVLEEARRRNAATIFTIVTPPVGELLQEQLRPRSLFELRKLSEETGGRSFTPPVLSDLAGVYDEIAVELNQQYWLAYIPAPSSSGRFKQIAVQMTGHPELRARTRSGYYGTPQRPGAPPQVRAR
jgi:Ca-activated chloride channel family protein